MAFLADELRRAPSRRASQEPHEEVSARPHFSDEINEAEHPTPGGVVTQAGPSASNLNGALSNASRASFTKHLAMPLVPLVFLSRNTAKEVPPVSSVTGEKPGPEKSSLLPKLTQLFTSRDDGRCKPQLGGLNRAHGGALGVQEELRTYILD